MNAFRTDLVKLLGLADLSLAHAEKAEVAAWTGLVFARSGDQHQRDTAREVWKHTANALAAVREAHAFNQENIKQIDLPQTEREQS